MIFHKSIWKYLAAIIDFFNDVSVEYKLSTGEKVVRNIPLVFSSREKMAILDQNSTKQLLTGNLNVLPRGSVTISSIVRDTQRMMNKFTKTNIVKQIDKQLFQFNSVPFNYTFEIEYICRGMSEATCLLEQICPKFNPNIVLDIWDAEFLSEPTKIPVQLLDTSIEIQQFEETSLNLATVNIGLQLNGWMYQAIQDESLIKQFLVNFGQQESKTISDVADWDVENSEATYNGISTSNNLELEGFEIPNLKIGTKSKIKLKYQSKKSAQLKFVWETDPVNAAQIEEFSDQIEITPLKSEFDLKCKVSDIFKNSKEISKHLKI